MRISKLKRVGSGMLAAAIAASAYVGAALPASARTPGKDGSAEMNEAYAAHESLMPIGPSFSSATILEWTPESDPDARYSRASIPLANRTGGFVVNPKANPEAKLMLCSLANSAHDTTGAQGTDNFMSWSFNYWQYADSFVYWSGSEEGIITCPTGEFTDAAHANGVPVVATLGFPWGSGDGYVEEVRAFTQQAADGSFPVADKLLEVMEYYGFDGYFFNQESSGCSAEDASRLNAMMKYMRKKCPDILISWYDAMVPGGSISHQDAVNEENKAWMEPDAEGNYCVDEFFMNYNWYESKVSTTVNTMNSINRSPFDAYAGLDVQRDGMNTKFRDYMLLDANGKMKLSFALYCPNSTLGISASGEDFHRNERIQDAVDAAYDALFKAKEALVASGEQSALIGLLSTAKQLDLSKYTEESGQAIRAAIKAAEEIIAARGTEEEIEAAYAVLEKALADAELLPTDPGTPEEPTDPENPDTGDYAPVALPMAFLMAGAAILTFKKRRDAR